MIRTVVTAIAALVVVSITGCARISGVLFGTPAEREYAERVRATESTFYVSTDRSDDTWAAAQTWLALYSSRPLKVITPWVLQTEIPEDQTQYGYTVTRLPQKGAHLYTVRCYRQRAWAGYTTLQENANWNEKVLSYYLQTGELPFPNLIQGILSL